MRKIVIAALLAAATAATSYGQEDKKLTVDVGADLVSSYVWRGMYTAGVSVQPSLSLSAYGVTLGAWGSTDVTAKSKEVDFALFYEVKGLSIGVTDYWWSGEDSSFFTTRGSHFFEASLSYTLPIEKFPLTLGVNAMLWGDGDKSDDGKQRYSTYFTASFPFTVKDVECEVGVGISPNKGGLYNEKDGVNPAFSKMAAISARATKKLHLSEKFELPVFAELILSPAQDNAFLVFGLRF